MSEQSRTRPPRQARARATVANVLAAAERLLAQEGVPALTMRRVAEDAGIGVASIYDYFPSRRDLLRAIVEGRLRQKLLVFDQQLLADDEAPVSARLLRYHQAIQDQRLVSGADLALREAYLLDPDAAEILHGFEVAFLERYQTFLHRFGRPDLPAVQASAMAKLNLALEQAAMMLAKDAPPPEAKALVGLKTHLTLEIMRHAGIRMEQELQEKLSKLTALAIGNASSEECEAAPKGRLPELADPA